MAELKELIAKIQELRKYMNHLIDQKGNLVDPEIIAVSKMIDTMLNEYEKLITRKDGA